MKKVKVGDTIIKDALVIHRGDSLRDKRDKKSFFVDSDFIGKNGHSIIVNPLRFYHCRMLLIEKTKC